MKNRFNLLSPPGLQRCFQSAYEEWALMMIPRGFIQNTYSGIFFSITFAFFFLLTSTQNFYISLMAVFCILGVILSTVSIIELQGWRLGISESLAMVIFIGFSVDYVVHIGHHYVESIHKDRFRRMNQSFSQIGLTIVSGALTTFMAGVSLLWTSLVVLWKMGILIMTTISFSLFFSLLLFPAAAYIFGPENHKGNLMHAFVWPIWNRI